MTVCIAALCAHSKKIVTVSDTKVAYGIELSADDLMLKSRVLARNWWVMYSGNDITDADFIMDDAAQRLAKSPTSDPLTVATFLHDAYTKRLCQQIEAKVLAPFKLTLEVFVRDGSKLSKSLQQDLASKVSAVHLDVEFILTGFDAKKTGHIILVDGRSAPASMDAPAFCVSGSGSAAANSAMLFHADRDNLSIYDDMENVVYCCLEAKFMAELALGVGRGTFLSILEADSDPKFISANVIDQEIRAHWEKVRSILPFPLLKRIPGMAFGFFDVMGFDKHGKPGHTEKMGRFLGLKKGGNFPREGVPKLFKMFQRMIPQIFIGKPHD